MSNVAQDACMSLPWDSAIYPAVAYNCKLWQEDVSDKHLVVAEIELHRNRITWHNKLLKIASWYCSYAQAGIAVMIRN